MVQQMRYTFTLYSIKVERLQEDLCALQEWQQRADETKCIKVLLYHDYFTS